MSAEEPSTATMTGVPDWLGSLVRDISDYPEPGITFRDITPLLGDADAFRRAIDELAGRCDEVDRVVGVEARGFILAAPVAYRLGASFVPVRKPGKLPWAVVREEYKLEYGSDRLEIHRDAIHPDDGRDVPARRGPRWLHRRPGDPHRARRPRRAGRVGRTPPRSAGDVLRRP
jgi:hypothetical protein